MGVRFYISEENATYDELRVAKRSAPTQQGFVRFQAIEELYRGRSPEDVAELSDRSVSTIYRWARDFNESGIDGVACKGKAGRPQKIARDKFACEYVPLILNPGEAGESHWTGLKFHGHLTKECREELGYSTLLRYLKEQDVVHRYPRRWPERQDEEQRAIFLKRLQELHSDPNNSLWFGDEVGFEGDPRPRRTWVKKGSKPKVPYFGDHIRYNTVGAVNPECGELFSLVVPHSDKEVFQAFLDEFAKHTAKTKKTTILVLDNARWHKHSGLRWHHIVPCFLPPYSPDFNPIEQIWKVLKERFFANWIAKTPEILIERICFAIQSLLADEISSIASIDHLLQ